MLLIISLYVMPLFRALFFNAIVGASYHRIPSRWFLGIGTLLTGVAHVLYATRREGAVYWTYELCGQLLSYGAAGFGKWGREQ